MFDISLAASKVSDAFKSLFDYAETAKERQSETQLIKELKKSQKAIDTAEKMFQIFFKHVEALPSEDKVQIERLLKKFLENN